jgi:tetratricopeptide (TPR) repeat protein
MLAQVPKHRIGRSFGIPRRCLLSACFLLVGISSMPAQRASSSPSSASRRQFLLALTAYRQQKFREAEAILRPLAGGSANSFDVNELLGLVYVAQRQDAKARPYLARAVQLKPRMGDAHTALATCLLRLQRSEEAETQFKKVVELEPRSYDANHNMGEFYVQVGRLPEAIVFLERAQAAEPDAQDNGYDLALAYEKTGNLPAARQQIQALLRSHDSADLHSLLGEIEEDSKNYVASAAQYEKAAHMDPSEQNLFDWGTELLLHQTFEPAVDVFQAGLAHFPQSFRLRLGYGIALYGLGRFDDGAREFFRAADIAPADPLPLTFLGQAYDNLSSALANQVEEHLRVYLDRNPPNAAVRYYYAMCLWSRNERKPSPDLPRAIESSLEDAIASDPSYARAYLQLGILYSEERKYDQAIPNYDQALKLAPDLPDVHYRLGQALARTGATARAQAEFARFEQLRETRVKQNNEQTTAIQQFVYTMRNSTAAGRAVPATGGDTKR